MFVFQRQDQWLYLGVMIWQKIVTDSWTVLQWGFCSSCLLYSKKRTHAWDSMLNWQQNFILLCSLAKTLQLTRQEWPRTEKIWSLLDPLSEPQSEPWFRKGQSWKCHIWYTEWKQHHTRRSSKIWVWHLTLWLTCYWWQVGHLKSLVLYFLFYKKPGQSF